MILAMFLISTIELGLVGVPQGGEVVPNDSTKPKQKAVIFNGTLNASDPFDWARSSCYHKVHNAKLQGGTRYTIIMNASFPPFLRVEDFRGNKVVDSRKSHPKQITFDYTPKKSETYRIVATSYSSRATGAYTITIREYTPPPPPKMIALVMGKNGVNVKGEITRNDGFDRVRKKHYAKIYSLKMVPGKQYTILSNTTRHDGYLRLEDSKGRQLASNDDFGSTRSSRIVFTPARADTYRIIVTTFSTGTTGPYTLTVK